METLKTVIFAWTPQLLKGARITIALTLSAVVVGLVFGLFLALGKISKNPFLSKLSSAYLFPGHAPFNAALLYLLCPASANPRAHH